MSNAGGGGPAKRHEHSQGTTDKEANERWKSLPKDTQDNIIACLNDSGYSTKTRQINHAFQENAPKINLHKWKFQSPGSQRNPIFWKLDPGHHQELVVMSPEMTPKGFHEVIYDMTKNFSSNLFHRIYLASGDRVLNQRLILFRKRIVKVVDMFNPWGERATYVNVFDLPFSLNCVHPKQQETAEYDPMPGFGLMTFFVNSSKSTDRDGFYDVRGFICKSQSPQVNHTHPLVNLFPLDIYRIRVDRTSFTQGGIEMIMRSRNREIAVINRGERVSPPIQDNFKYLTIILINDAGRMMFALQDHDVSDDRPRDPNEKFEVHTQFWVDVFELLPYILESHVADNHGIMVQGFRNSPGHKKLLAWARMGIRFDGKYGSPWHVNHNADVFPTLSMLAANATV